MNPDDPKLTAYALDELDPTERAEIEQLLRENPTALTEVEETTAFTARLRRELKAEAGAPLTEEQRTALLALSETQPATDVVAFAGKSRGSNWTRFWLPLAAAVTIVAGGAAILVDHTVFLRRIADATPSPTFVADATAAADLSREPQFAPVISLDLPSPAGVPSDSQQQVAAPPILQSITTTNQSGAFTGTLAANGGMSAVPHLPNSESKAHIASTGSTAGSAVGHTATMGGTSRLTKSGAGTIQTDAFAKVPKGDVTLNSSDASDLNGFAFAPTPTSAAKTLNSKALVTNQGAAFSGGTLVKSGSGTVTVGGKVSEVETRRINAPSSPEVAAAKPATTLALASKDKSKVEQQLDDISRLGSVSTTTALAPTPLPDPGFGNTEAYDAITDNAFLAVRENPLSTFSIDVDTASYANVRRFLSQQSRPPKGAVRIEELLNYFTYDYPQPEGDAPFSATMEVAACPWAPEHRLVRVGLKGREIAEDKRPASNLVFLIDVSGSMQPENKLPLLKKCLAMLVDRLSPEDTVSIAVYAGASGTVLEPTHSKREMRNALDRLESGGSTNRAAGIQLAYRLAEKSFIKGGVNRVILATDGDFNVGVTSQSDLVELIERKAKGGVFLTVLGFGMDNLKDSTLEKLADKGNGNYAYIDTLNEGRKVLVEQMNGTLVTIAKDVKIQVEFNPAQVGAYRLIGYENRLLAKEDFNDDKKDAGEIGAGHTVTALYEVVPAGQAAPGTPAVDALKYQRPTPAAETATPASRQELLTLKLRYKQPDGDVSKLLEFPLTDRGETWEKSSRDFRFAAAVAGFGMLLRDSPHKGTATWDSVRELAMEGRGEDRSGYRGEFLTLLDKAKALGR